MIDPIVMLDTDVASAEFKGRQLPLLTKISSSYRPIISFVTRGEMTKWSEMRSWAPRSRSRLSTWLELMPTVHSTDAISDQWGELSSAAARRGRPGPQNDPWIAAVCLTYEIPLATLNLKDFEDFETYHELKIVRA